jgi:hypothetical protein
MVHLYGYLSLFLGVDRCLHNWLAADMCNCSHIADAPFSLTTMFPTLPTALQLLISPLLLLLKPNDIHASPQMGFTLRHQHAVANDRRVVFADVDPFSSFVESRYVLNTDTIHTYRPASFSAFNRARSRVMKTLQSEANLWSSALTTAPDVEDRETLLTLAKMTSNAYFRPDSSEWYDLPSPWANHVSFIVHTFDGGDH